MIRALLLSLLLLPIGLAPKPQASAAVELTVWLQEMQQPVEQQTLGGQTQPDTSLWVVNNTGCIWDTDDYWRAFGGASITSGDSIVVTRCIIADWIAHLWAAKVSAKNNADFRLTLSVPEFGFSVSKDAVLVGRIKQAQMCVSGPEYGYGSPLLEPIPNSGYGGVGKQVTATWTITNTGERTIRDVDGSYDVTPNWSNYQDLFCPHGWPIWEHGQTSGLDPRFWWD